MRSKKIILLSLIVLMGLHIKAQKKINYEVGTAAYLSSESNLPFWSVTNKNGEVPDMNAVVTDISFFNQFNKKSSEQLDYELGFSASGALADESELIISQAYARFSWKKVLLSIGSRYEDTQFDGLSATNGNLYLSNNARAIPRISIGSQDFWNLPFCNNWLAVKGMYSEGIMLDDRYVDNTRVHYKNAYLKIGGDRKFNLIVGFQHYAQWGGTSFNPEIGKITTDMENYLRMLVGKGGSEGQLSGEQRNALGNHLGGWDYHITYKAEKIDWELYRQTLFEDKSGTYFHRPDGVTGLHARFHGENQWISSILYEHFYTRFQSGSTPGGVPKPDGTGDYTGMDNYFNNYVYRSGWTYHGRTIGLPLFTPKQEDKNGHTLGVMNNRIVAHHLGVKGYLFNKVPYRTYLTFSQNWGLYADKFEGGMKEQFSGMFEVHLPKHTLPFEMSFAITMDKGELYKDSFGCFLKISKHGIF
eukprot:TRINITY_DN258_c1_g1_i4.p1 TRINITY_DN258_c1_g1~~TRINITY_DN258_c1_g1_i4.p1  ORF type:complete len:472 (+),score=0.72 TRINITY_DN258_c1_g1_i4:426-1841(+)